MEYFGHIKKMGTYNDSPIRYYLSTDHDAIEMNLLIGKQISLSLIKWVCVRCHQTHASLFRQGHCKRCYFESPETSESIYKPELSKAHLGIEVKDLEWEQKFELQPHIIYIAYSDKIKVGITRKVQLPTRWIDQGALHAVSIAEVPNRYLSGVGEVALKEYFADKTHWSAMLKATPQHEQIEAVDNARTLALQHLPEEVKPYAISDSAIVSLEYPIDHTPTKIKSVSLAKQTEVEGKLMGIKGQYLFLDESTVMNVRSQEGAYVSLRF